MAAGALRKKTAISWDVPSFSRAVAAIRATSKLIEGAVLTWHSERNTAAFRPL